MYGPILCHQMLSAVVCSQSIVSSLRAAKPSAPFGGWHRWHEASMRLAVWSSALHLQFVEGTKPHLCIVERNSPMLVRRWFSLTQEGLGRIIPGGEGPAEGINVMRWDVFFCHSVFHSSFAQRATVVLDLSRSFSSSSAAGTKGCLDLSSRWCVVGVNRNRSWRRCSGFIARRARDSVALFRQSWVGYFY